MKTNNPVAKGRAIPLGQPLSEESFIIAENFAKALRLGINDIKYKGRAFCHQRTIAYDTDSVGLVRMSAYRTRDGGYRILAELIHEVYEKQWAQSEAPWVEMKKMANHFKAPQKHKVLVRMIERTLLKALNEAPLWEQKHRLYEKIEAIRRAYPDQFAAALIAEMDATGRIADYEQMEADEVEGWMTWATNYKTGTDRASMNTADLPVEGEERDESGPRGQEPSGRRLPDMGQLPAREVPILARGDDGEYHVSPEYYSLNPNEGETVRTEKDHNAALALAQIIEEAIVDVVEIRPKYRESIYVDVAYVVREVFPHVHQGDVFDWAHIQMSVDASLRTRLGLTSKEEGLSARVPEHYTAYFLHLEQTIWWWQRAQDNEKLPLGGPVFPDMHIGNPDGNLCEPQRGPYIGFDQFKNCGAPTFSPMCKVCMEAVEYMNQEKLVCEMCSRAMPAKDFVNQWCGECANMKGPARDNRWASKGQGVSTEGLFAEAEYYDDKASGKPEYNDQGPLSDDEQRAKLLNVPKVSRATITGWLNNRWQIEDTQVAQGEFKVYFSDLHYTLGLEKFDTYHDGTSQMYKVRMILLGPDGTLENPDILFEDVIDIPGYGSFIGATGATAAEVALTRTLRPSLWASTQRRRKFWASTETIHIRRWIDRTLAQQREKESTEDAENDGAN